MYIAARTSHDERERRGDALPAASNRNSPEDETAERRRCVAMPVDLRQRIMMDACHAATRACRVNIVSRLGRRSRTPRPTDSSGLPSPSRPRPAPDRPVTRPLAGFNTGPMHQRRRRRAAHRPNVRHLPPPKITIADICPPYLTLVCRHFVPYSGRGDGGGGAIACDWLVGSDHMSPITGGYSAHRL